MLLERSLIQRIELRWESESFNKALLSDKFSAALKIGRIARRYAQENMNQRIEKLGNYAQNESWLNHELDSHQTLRSKRLPPF